MKLLYGQLGALILQTIMIRMLKVSIVFILSFIMPEWLNSQSLTTQEYRERYAHHYVKEELLQKVPNFKEIQNGHFLEVPVDYTNSKKGNFEIYYRLPFGFDTDKDTVIYVSGGPGSAEHTPKKDIEKKFFFASKNHNVVFFDQRGTGLSVPKDKETFYSPEFYDSNFIVSDMERIRQHLKIKKWSVAGISWGTLLASKYASKFPENTISIILSGVVTSNLEKTEKNWEPIKKYYQLRFQELTPSAESLLEKIRMFDEDWLNNTLDGHSNNTGNYGINALIKVLNRTTSPKEVIDQKWLNELDEQIFQILEKTLLVNSSGTKEEALISKIAEKYNSYINRITSILDLMSGKEEEFRVKYSSGFFQILPHDGIYDDVSKEIDVPYDEMKVYKLDQYKINIPVFYINGELDTTTLIKGAQKHQDISALTTSQAINLKGVGHNTSLPFYFSHEGQEQFKKMKSLIFKYWLKGEEIPIENLKEINTNYPIKFEVR